MKNGLFILMLFAFISCTKDETQPYGKWVTEDADVTFFEKKYESASAETEYKKQLGVLKASLENDPIEYIILKENNTITSSEDTSKVSFWKYDSSLKELCFSNTESFTSQSCQKIISLSGDEMVMRSELPDMGYIIFRYKRVKI